MATKRRSEAIWIESKSYWQIKVQKNGVRKAFTSSIKGRKGKHDAEGKADIWLERGTTEMCFREAWEAFLEDQQAHTKTANYKKHEYIGRTYLMPDLKNERLHNITPNKWRKCIDRAFKAGLARRSIKNVRLSISAFINFCCRERWQIERLERGDIVIPQDAPEAKRTILQPDTLKTLFTIDYTTWKGKQHPAFFIHAFRFLVVTGLRRGELCGLKNEDIKGRVLDVKRSINAQGEETRGKNDNARRTIYLSQRALEILDAQRKNLAALDINSEWVFPDKYGERLNGYLLWQHWDRYRKQHGIESSLHELRHTFVSVMQNDMPEPMLKAVVGHSDDMDTYGVYGHETTDAMKKAADIIDSTFTYIISNP